MTEKILPLSERRPRLRGRAPGVTLTRGSSND